MNEPDDVKLKGEIDEIAKRIDETLKKIENLDPAKQEPAEQEKNWPKRVNTAQSQSTFLWL